MKRVILISLTLSVVYALAQGQVIDTAKKINTWKLMHNFTRFEEVPMDTNMHQLQKDYQPIFDEGFAYEYIGILGQAANHVDYMKRPDPDFFVFGIPWNPYLKTPSRTTFYNTQTPFTSLAYSTMFFVNQAPEENVEALHTQNLSPYTNFGIDFNILSSKALYINEEAKVNRVGLFGSHAKDRYSIFGTFYYNNFRLRENGGLESVDDFLKDDLDRVWQYPVQRTEANNVYRNLSFFATQTYHLLEKSIHVDSLGNKTSSGKNFSLSHQLYFDRHMKRYSDDIEWIDGALPPMYDNYYYTVSNPYDSVSEDKISNVFQIILGDPDYDKISLRAYAGYEIRRFGMLSPAVEPVFSHYDTISQDPLELLEVYSGDTTVARFNDRWYHDVYLGFNMAGPTTGTWDWVLDGQYYLLGYYQNDFRINATFSREFLKVARLGLRGSMELRKPHYFVMNYSSSFFRWDQDFPSMFRIKGEAFSKSDELGMDLRASVAYVRNYQYWSEEALPAVYEDDILVLSGTFSKHFRFSGFNSEDKLLLQYSSAGNIMPLPMMAVYSSNYWQQPLFKGALVTTLGFDLYYTTKYKASAYMPATGVFHLQNEYDVGAFPFLDVFLTLRIARTRIFVSYNNLLHGGDFLGNNYFTTYRYPMKPRNLRLGLVWTFYD